jgi:hypothetical protein
METSNTVLPQLIAESRETFASKCIFKFSDLDNPAAIAELKDAIVTCGVAIVLNAIPNSEVKQIEQDIRGIAEELGEHYPQLADTRISQLTEALLARKAATGIIAAKQTGMFNMFPAAAKDSVKTELEGVSEVVDRNLWYSRVNLALLRRNPALAALLLCSSGEQPRAISIDTGKLANERFAATALHIDHYFADRVQACLAVREDGSRSLGYLPANAHLNAWLTERQLLTGAPGLKKISDFLSAAEVEIIAQALVAPPPRSLVLWHSGVIHGEFNSALKEGDRFRTALSPLDRPVGGQILRLYLGTHRTSLQRDTIIKQQYWAVRGGLCPSRFRHVRGSPIDKNNMAQGTTGAWFVCKREPEELQSVANTAEELEAIPLEQQASELSPLELQFGGLTQLLGALPPEFRRLLTEEQQTAWQSASLTQVLQ